MIFFITFVTFISAGLIEYQISFRLISVDYQLMD